MLQLKNITKTYTTGELTQEALSDLTVNFRASEFVAVLGQSGSGKTTLLNIVGGLDRYDSGDLIIRETSTKKYKDADWDAYRNHSVGFVFQSYNLIPHQTVLANVELALTLSGVSKTERRRRAKDVLTKVGLGDQLHKKPNQMSGGQMQRVAIARALVNNPDILLADEPTGALDSETSVQVIDLLKEIAEDRLIIMVTHNPDLAAQYANRIIRLKDGKITDDSNPYSEDDRAADLAAVAPPVTEGKRKNKKAKTSMSFVTALALSLNNLMTKKTRTILTSFAGSIGIIGIALILALSSGFQDYIDSVQQDTLSSYPLTIETDAMDISAFMSARREDRKTEDKDPVNDGKIRSNTAVSDMLNTRTANIWNNNLKEFKIYLESNVGALDKYVNAVRYSYGVPLNIYAPGTADGPRRLNPSPLSEVMGGGGAMQTNAWRELLDNRKLLESQYELLAGNWPENFDEVVLVVDSANEIDEVTLVALGVRDVEDYMAAVRGESTELPEPAELTYEDILAIYFSLVLQPDYFILDTESGLWTDKSDDEEHIKTLIDNGVEIKITGILRPNESSVATASSDSFIGYLKSLPEYVITETGKREIVKKQLADPLTDVFINLPFEQTQTAEDSRPAEESTTAPPVTASTAGTTAQGVAPKPGNLAFAGEAPSVAYVETTTAAPAPAMTEDEVYAYIRENFSGEEQEKLLEFATLFLKNTRSISERRRLIAFFDEQLAGQDIEGMGNITGQQAYSYIALMDKNTKLRLLTGIIKAVEEGESPTAPPQKPDPTNPGTPGQPTPQEPVTEPPVEEEPPAPTVSKATLEENLEILGVADLSTPRSIRIYPKNFESKDAIEQFIKDYNEQMQEQGKDENAIEYTDFIGLIMSSVTRIINIVSYVLIAFVSISLVVSSIMIGIITYISVLERTKEIGILRSIGASKRDISRVFNAETVIVGFVAGAMGIGATVLLCIPLNIVIERLADIADVAKLPLVGGVALIVISMLLTTVAGLIPSRMAAKKDPVVALRTE